MQVHRLDRVHADRVRTTFGGFAHLDRIAVGLQLTRYRLCRCHGGHGDEEIDLQGLEGIDATATKSFDQLGVPIIGSMCGRPTHLINDARNRNACGCHEKQNEPIHRARPSLVRCDGDAQTV